MQYIYITVRLRGSESLRISKEAKTIIQYKVASSNYECIVVKCPNLGPVQCLRVHQTSFRRHPQKNYLHHQRVIVGSLRPSHVQVNSIYSKLIY